MFKCHKQSATTQMGLTPINKIENILHKISFSQPPLKKNPTLGSKESNT